MHVLVLGAGYTGRAVLLAARGRGLAARGVVRREEAAADLRAAGLEAVVVPSFGEGASALVTPETHVVVTFPPDGATDARLASSLPAAAAITYVSATSVYGSEHHRVDDTTPTATRPSASGARRLEAERVWRARGATVLRAPAIYGPDRGLHVRVLQGAHRIPGDGSGFVSRIHVEDLAELVLAAPRASGETFVVGDDAPAPHVEVIRFVCDAYGVPMPPFVPLESVHETLRGDRRVDGSRALARLGVVLRWPTYRLGMAPAVTTRRPPDAT